MLNRPYDVSARTILTWFAGGAACAYILLFAGLAGVRMLYPYELDWTESAYVDQARWILTGNALYAPPDIHFLPTGKTPFYFYAAAGMMKLLGEGFFPARLLSTLAALGCFILLTLIVRKETNSLPAGLMAAGIYAASYRFTGAWMDLAAVDSVFLFLILLAFWVGLRWEGSWGILACGALLVAAFFTKQLALPVAAALAAGSLLHSRGRGWAAWLVSFSLGLGIFLLWDAVSNGWFSFYTLEVSLRHPRSQDFLSFWKIFLPRMFPAALLALAYAAPALRNALISAPWRSSPSGQVVEQPATAKRSIHSDMAPDASPHSRAWLYLALSAGLILASWSIYLKVWTYDNGLMPAVLGVAILAGLGFTRLERRWPLAGVGLVLLQFVLLIYSPAAQLPSRQTRQQAGEFIQWLNALPGEAWVFSHTYYARLAGKETFFHSANYGDVMGAAAPGSPALNPNSDFSRRWEQVATTFGAAVSSQRFDWVIVDQPADYWLPYYTPDRELDYEFYPLTGAPTRPRLLLVRRSGVARDIPGHPFLR